MKHITSIKTKYSIISFHISVLIYYFFYFCINCIFTIGIFDSTQYVCSSNICERGNQREVCTIKSIKKQRYSNQNSFSCIFLTFLPEAIYSSYILFYTHAHIRTDLCTLLYAKKQKRRREKEENVQAGSNMNVWRYVQIQVRIFSMYTFSYIFLHFRPFMHTFSKKVNVMQYVLVHT